MATKKNAEPSEQKPEKQKPEKQPKKAARADASPEADAPQKPDGPHNEDALQKAAKAIGSALGTMAVKTGIAHPAATPPKKKIPKLVKKTKQRLPRKEKKEAKKKLAKSAG